MSSKGKQAARDDDEEVEMTSSPLPSSSISSIKQGKRPVRDDDIILNPGEPFHIDSSNQEDKDAVEPLGPVELDLNSQQNQSNPANMTIDSSGTYELFSHQRIELDESFLGDMSEPPPTPKVKKLKNKSGEWEDTSKIPVDQLSQSHLLKKQPGWVVCEFCDHKGLTVVSEGAQTGFFKSSRRIQRFMDKKVLLKEEDPTSEAFVHRCRACDRTLASHKKNGSIELLLPMDVLQPSQKESVVKGEAMHAHELELEANENRAPRNVANGGGASGSSSMGTTSAQNNSRNRGESTDGSGTVNPADTTKRQERRHRALREWLGLNRSSVPNNQTEENNEDQRADVSSQDTVVA